MGAMDNITAVRSIGALAHESRLAIFRLLVVAGPAGLTAGTIADRLGIGASALSFHLKDLSHAEMVVSRHEGRHIHYSANFDTMNALLGFLTENCCEGGSCGPLETARKSCKQEVS